MTRTCKHYLQLPILSYSPPIVLQLFLLLATLLAAPAFGQTTQPVTNPITKANAALAKQSKHQRAKVALRSYAPGRADTPTTLDLTGRTYGGECDGDAFNLSYSGEGYGFDLTGSQNWTVESLMASTQNGKAKAIFRLARPPGGYSAGLHHFENVAGWGYPRDAILHIDGSESNLFENCQFDSYTKAPAVLITTESGGLIALDFVNCHFSTNADDGVAVHIKFGPNTCEQIRFTRCSFTATRYAAKAGLFIESPTGSSLLQLVVEDCSFECDAARHAILSTCPTALTTIRGNRMFSRDECIKLGGGEHAGLLIERNHLKSWTRKPVIDVSATNYASKIEALYYVHDPGDIWARIGDAPRTTIIGFEDKVQVRKTPTTVLRETP